MNPIRKLLRLILGLLSRLAIKRHKLELIVVAGWYGTSLAREMLYTVLSDRLKVRRNTSEIWWDFSIPLAILGYKDKRRNPFEWVLLIIRATLYLFFGRYNPHVLILDADCTYNSTASYWASFVKPDYLLVLNYEREAAVVRELVDSTDKKNATVIFNPETTSKSLVKKLKKHRTFTFGKEKGRSLTVKTNKKKIKIGYNQKQIALPKSYLPSFSTDMLGGVFAVAVLKGLNLTEAGFNSLKFELPTKVVTKIRSKLEFNRLQ
ncbi:MAG: hypothetical protein ACE5DX_03575 [Candidatus Dojkabacteria bacterium]